MNLLDSIKRKLSQTVGGAVQSVKNLFQPKLLSPLAPPKQPVPKPPSFSYTSPKAVQNTTPISKPQAVTQRVPTNLLPAINRLYQKEITPIFQPIIQGIKQARETPPPTFNFPQIKQPLLRKGAETLAYLPGVAVKSIATTPFIAAKGIKETGGNIIKLAQGQQVTPQQMLGGIGDIGEAVLNLYTMGKGSALKSAAKELGSQKFFPTLLKGAKASAPYGTAYSLTGGMQTGREIPTLPEYGAHLAKSMLTGTALAGGLGVAGAGVGYGLNRGARLAKTTYDTQVAKQFADDIGFKKIELTQHPVIKNYVRAFTIDPLTEKEVISAVDKVRLGYIGDPKAMYDLHTVTNANLPQFKRMNTPDLAKVWDYILARKNGTAPDMVPAELQMLDKSITDYAGKVVRQSGKINLGADVLPKTPAEAIKPSIGEVKPQSIKQYKPEDLFDLVKFTEGKSLGIKERGFIKTVRESKTTVPEVAQQVKGFYTPITNRQTVNVARRVIKENYDLAKERVFKEPLTAETNTIGMELMAKAQKEKRFDEAIEIAEHLAKKGTETGQAIQSFSIWSRLTPAGMLRYAQKQIQESSKKLTFGKLLGKQAPKLTVGETEKVTELMTKAGKATTEEAKATYIREVMEIINNKIPWGVSDIVDTYRYNNMLSSPLTQLRNLWNNTLTTFAVKPATLITAGRPMEAAKYEVAALKSIPAGIDSFIKAFTGKTPLDLSKLDIQSVKAKKFPLILGWPSRAMEAADQFFMTLMKSGEMARGKSADEAFRSAQYSLLRSDLTPKGQGYLLNALDNIPKGLYHLRKVPFLGWTIPFIKTPFNFGKMWLEYSPMGVGTIPGAADKRGQIGKAILGSMVSLVGMKAALEGKTTWSTPTDEKEKELFYASGRKPFSLLIGDKWIPMATFGPLAWALALPAAHQFYQKESKTSLSDTDMEKAGKELSSLLYFFSQSTPMEGLGSFVQMAEGNMDMNLSRIAARNLSQLKPWEGLMNYISRVVDPIYRKATTFEEQLKSDVPFLTKELPAYKEPSGELSQRGLLEFLLPYGGKTIQPEYEKQLKELQGIKREVEPFKKAGREAKAEKAKGESVEELYTKLKNLPREEANKQARELKKTDSNRYSQLKQMVKDKKAGVTLRDEVIRTLELEPRTNYLIQELNKVSSREEKNEKVKEWKSKGIVTDGVMKKLKKAKQKGTLKPPGIVSGVRGAIAGVAPDNFQPNVREFTKEQNIPLPGGSGPKPIDLIKKYFPENEWDNAYKVMMGESGGNPMAIGDNYPIRGEVRPSYGLFQIRTFPNRPSPMKLLHPEENVAYAAQLWKSQGWRPWTAARKLGIR